VRIPTSTRRRCRAGTNFGAVYIPRIGQEVLVEFLEGDPDKPIVTGRLLNVALNRTSTITGQYHIQTDAEYKVTHKDNVVLLKGTKTQVTNGKCTLTLDGGKIVMEAPEGITITCGSSSMTLSPKDLAIASVKVGVAGGTTSTLALDAAGAEMVGNKAVIEGKATAQMSAPVVKVN
jgi:hypothetical protein